MEPGSGGDDPVGALSGEALAQFGWCGVDHGVELVGGLGAGLDGAASCDAQQPDRFHRAGL